MALEFIYRLLIKVDDSLIKTTCLVALAIFGAFPDHWMRRHDGILIYRYEQMLGLLLLLR